MGLFDVMNKWLLLNSKLLRRAFLPHNVRRDLETCQTIVSFRKLLAIETTAHNQRRGLRELGSISEDIVALIPIICKSLIGFAIATVFLWIFFILLMVSSPWCANFPIFYFPAFLLCILAMGSQITAALCLFSEQNTRFLSRLPQRLSGADDAMGSYLTHVLGLLAMVFAPTVMIAFPDTNSALHRIATAHITLPLDIA